ncbi:unnamed protein product, partial [Polarella glacialis]
NTPGSLGTSRTFSKDSALAARSLGKELREASSQFDPDSDDEQAESRAEEKEAEARRVGLQDTIFAARRKSLTSNATFGRWASIGEEKSAKPKINALSKNAFRRVHLGVVLSGNVPKKPVKSAVKVFTNSLAQGFAGQPAPKVHRFTSEIEIPALDFNNDNNNCDNNYDNNNDNNNNNDNKNFSEAPDPSCRSHSSGSVSAWSSDSENPMAPLRTSTAVEKATSKSSDVDKPPRKQRPRELDFQEAEVPQREAVRRPSGHPPDIHPGLVAAEKVTAKKVFRPIQTIRNKMRAKINLLGNPGMMMRNSDPIINNNNNKIGGKKANKSFPSLRQAGSMCIMVRRLTGEAPVGAPSPAAVEACHQEGRIRSSTREYFDDGSGDIDVDKMDLLIDEGSREIDKYLDEVDDDESDDEDAGDVSEVPKEEEGAPSQVEQMTADEGSDPEGNLRRAVSQVAAVACMQGIARGVSKVAVRKVGSDPGSPIPKQSRRQLRRRSSQDNCVDAAAMQEQEQHQGWEGEQDSHDTGQEQEQEGEQPSVAENEMGLIRAEGVAFGEPLSPRTRRSSSFGVGALRRPSVRRNSSAGKRAVPDVVPRTGSEAGTDISVKPSASQHASSLACHGLTALREARASRLLRARQRPMTGRARASALDPQPLAGLELALDNKDDRDKRGAGSGGVDLAELCVAATSAVQARLIVQARRVSLCSSFGSASVAPLAGPTFSASGEVCEEELLEGFVGEADLNNNNNKNPPELIPGFRSDSALSHSAAKAGWHRSEQGTDRERAASRLVVAMDLEGCVSRKQVQQPEALSDSLLIRSLLDQAWHPTSSAPRTLSPLPAMPQQQQQPQQQQEQRPQQQQEQEQQQEPTSCAPLSSLSPLPAAIPPKRCFDHTVPLSCQGEALLPSSSDLRHSPGPRSERSRSPAANSGTEEADAEADRSQSPEGGRPNSRRGLKELLLQHKVCPQTELTGPQGSGCRPASPRRLLPRVLDGVETLSGLTDRIHRRPSSARSVPRPPTAKRSGGRPQTARGGVGEAYAKKIQETGDSWRPRPMASMVETAAAPPASLETMIKANLQSWPCRRPPSSQRVRHVAPL